jgi:hypothetical protein
LAVAKEGGSHAPYIVIKVPIASQYLTNVVIRLDVSKEKS